MTLLTKILQKPIAFHRIFAQISGSATSGLFLSQLWYWHDKGSDPNGWIYKSYDEWQEETCLSRCELDRARKKLKTLGILEEKKEGLPCRIFYRINQNTLEQTILQFAESDKLDCEILQTRSPDPTNSNAESDKLEREILQTRSPDPANILYTENTSENTSETTRDYAHGEARPQKKPNIKNSPEESITPEIDKQNYHSPSSENQPSEYDKFSEPELANFEPSVRVETSNQSFLPKEQQRDFWRALTAYVEKTNPAMSRGRAESIASASTERLLNQVPKVQDQEYLEMYLQGVLPCYTDDRISYQTIKDHQTLEELKGMLYDE